MPERVLFLTHIPPYPASSGDAVRNLNLMKQLHRDGFEVSLFTLQPNGEIGLEAREHLESFCRYVVTAPAMQFRRRGLKVAVSTLRQEAFHADYFWDPQAAATLSAHLETHSYDLVMMQLAYMSRYADLCPAPRVFDTHNAEVLRLGNMARGSGISPRSLGARLQIGPARALEARLVEQSILTLACSPNEYRYFRAIGAGDVEYVPNGVDIDSSPQRPHQPESDRLLFLGSLDYSANVDAVEVLLREILPRLHCPVAIDIVGRNPPPSLQALGKGTPTIFHGFVADLEPLADTARAMVVPLRFGGGTRLKILDAFARGIPVVSTSVGCEGLDVQDGTHLLIADGYEDFAQATERLMIDGDLCARLAANARSLAEETYDWDRIGTSLNARLHSILSSAGPLEAAA